MNMFQVVSPNTPKGDQPKAIERLADGVIKGEKFQVLLGATGTGKTFTIANVIQKVQKPTLILAHNKTLAAQLYAEFKALFPHNRVEYFISNFDYYQPEAYMPKTDTYIDKTSKSNMDIEMMRLSTISSLTTRPDTIVVASVASIYGQNDPEIYKELSFMLRVGDKISKIELLSYLVTRGYKRNDVSNDRATFRAKGDVIEVSPGWTDEYFLRIELFGDEIERLYSVDTVTGNTLITFPVFRMFPADGYVTTRERLDQAISLIESELTERLAEFKKEHKLVEYQRLEMRVKHDLEALREFGMCSGIENYSRHLDLRNAGEAPWTLMDYFPKDYLTVIDESHQMIPQVRAMYNGDRARKLNLVEYGFRLPSALDNRPLIFDEWEAKINQAIFVSATPADYELDKTEGVIVEQIIRPTGLIDPTVEIKPSKGQIDDLVDQIKNTINKGERVMVTTLTKKMAEDLTEHLKTKDIKVAYLHSEIKTLERIDIINNLRKGKFDVLIGINLLREGLDIPEVSLIAILDADKEGFLRSDTSLIQIIGRAARNANGHVIMYADNMTGSMQRALGETDRRRAIQIAYNKKHGITPTTIIKELRENIAANDSIENAAKKYSAKKMTKLEKQKLIDDLKVEMKAAAKSLEFERAAELRDIILELESEI